VVILPEFSQIDTHLLPLFKDLLISLAGGIAFSKRDLVHAYQQVVLDDESKAIEIIITHKGLYRVNRLPFGVAFAHQCFNKS
jgi:hypothetical protein